MDLNIQFKDPVPETILLEWARGKYSLSTKPLLLKKEFALPSTIQLISERGMVSPDQILTITIGMKRTQTKEILIGKAGITSIS